MALVKKENKRLEHPTEPDAWFVVRVPLSAGDLMDMGQTTSLAAVKFQAILCSLKEWSLAEPIDDANVKLLDLDTFNWLSGKVFELSKLPEPEKKGSGSSSPVITAPAEEPSLVSSGT